MLKRFEMPTQIPVKLTCLLRMFVLFGALLSGCASQPATSEISFALTRTTDQQKFIVTLQPLADPVTVNQIHSWQIRLTTAAGMPVSKAQIFIGGGMPDHGHGFPTRPQVRELPGDGNYLLEGMKFSMHGHWEIKLGIQARDVFDVVTINTMVALPAINK
jgi:hypothetical protein